MGTQTYGTGADEFTLTYLDTTVPDSGLNEGYSTDISEHMLSALELKNLSSYYESAPTGAMSDLLPDNSPLSRGQSGASQGYYRTLHYKSNNTGSYFFTQNFLMYDRHVVTDITDLQRLVWNPTVTTQTQTVTMLDGSSKSVTLYNVTGYQADQVDILKHNSNTQTVAAGINVMPGLICPTVSDTYQAFPYWSRDCETITWIDNTVGRYAQTFAAGGSDTARYSPDFGGGETLAFPNNTRETHVWVNDVSGKYIMDCRYRAGDQYSYMTNMYANVKYYVCDEDELLHVLARGGLKFKYNDTLYKPVANNGIITGYTANMDEESEWDNWHNLDDHEIPTEPPATPKPTPGHWDDINSSGTFGSALGFVQAYYLSRNQLTALKTWMGKDESSGGPPDGYDMINAIVGIKMYPWELATAATDTINIVIPESQSLWVSLAQQFSVAAIAASLAGGSPTGNAPTPIRTVDSGVSAFATDAGMRQYDLGSLDMRQFVNTKYPFLTYDASIELYIPFCGTFTLDTQSVMGRTLHAYLNLDPGSGEVYGYCMCDNVMIASGLGNIGVDVPVSSAQIGVYRAKADTIRANQIMGEGVTLATLGTGLPAAEGAAYRAMSDAIGNVPGSMLAGIGFKAGVSAIQPHLSSAMVATATNTLGANRQIKQLRQSHSMAMAGSAGSGTAAWCCPWKAFVKIIRPKPHDPGANYNHASAVPAYNSKTLGTYSGLTVCINPDVSDITNATANERNAIAAILSGGVIV